MWSPDSVFERYQDAVATLRLLPGDMPRRYFNAWPDIVRNPSEGYGYREPRAVRSTAGPGAIDRLDETLEWNNHLSRQELRAVWCAASGVPKRYVAKRLRVSVSTVYRLIESGLLNVAAELNTRR